MTREPADATDPKSRLWLCDVLWQLGCVQFGDFTLGRTVRNSPVYLNPKLLISSPSALSRVASLIDSELETAMAMRNQQVTPFEAIAGVPIGGLHVATALSLRTDVPLVYARPDPPGQHGRPHIEGVYRPGQVTLIVDDLAAGGGSLVETATRLRQAALVVRDAVVLVDREQGATRRLKEIGVRLHPILTLDVLLNYLHNAGHIAQPDYERSMEYLLREGEARSEFD